MRGVLLLLSSSLLRESSSLTLNLLWTSLLTKLCSQMLNLPRSAKEGGSQSSIFALPLCFLVFC